MKLSLIFYSKQNTSLRTSNATGPAKVNTPGYVHMVRTIALL